MILLVDGRSGSGKTELAKAVTAGTDIQCVHMDALYPGWDGLADGSAAVLRLLREHRWRGWDWDAGVPGTWHEIDPGRSLVVEGCSAITAETVALADWTVWVECADDLRRERALRREPEFATHWDGWAAQEATHIETHQPRELASEIIDGSSVAAVSALAERVRRECGFFSAACSGPT